MTLFWQAKIWGLLHTPILKALYLDASANSRTEADDHLWRTLPAMQDWLAHDFDPDQSSTPLANHLQAADQIASASDRAAIANLDVTVNYDDEGLSLTHLLSAESISFKLERHNEIITQGGTWLNARNADIFGAIPTNIASNPKALFFWLWRCLPVETARQFGEGESKPDDRVMLLPANNCLPDASVWSHASMTSALAGSLTGFDHTLDDLTRSLSDDDLSRPYLARFTFSPIQELIKASRKMRDFWAGSWLLHYLSAKVSYALAKQYGPDCLLYPSLYEQPLVDRWLCEDFPEFEPWIDPPSDRTLLTAGFPNVLVVILPQAKVKAAMQMARQTLLKTWQDIGDGVLKDLQDKRSWQRHLDHHASSWGGWLDSQWQTYWSAVPIGAPSVTLQQIAHAQGKNDTFDKWLQTQNDTYRSNLFQEAELNFLQEVDGTGDTGDTARNTARQTSSVNVGSWWAPIFDRVGLAVASAKNPRSWQLPTAFGPRSTISGLGPVVYSGRNLHQDWTTEKETDRVWTHTRGIFDGIEQLNATETLKRGLEQILPTLLTLRSQEEQEIKACYPDLSSGVAGYIKCCPDRRDAYLEACEAVLDSQDWIADVIQNQAWGIPWLDSSDDLELVLLKDYPPRLLSPGWLAEDAEDDELKTIAVRIESGNSTDTDRQRAIEIRTGYREELRTIIDRHYPNGSPADWYVLAVGDGDSMSEWLKGKYMQLYQEYLAQSVKDGEKSETFEAFIQQVKRMGPATHNALSRSLLDFSGRLVPYLTEHRYAGRLIYCGGDDVLAYTNLWEWDRWLWDIRQCFKGAEDPSHEFESEGDYWRWNDDREFRPKILPSRPLFTLGDGATISFGVVIAHHSVPLAIALGELWEAEAEAKKHQYVRQSDAETLKKDAVQVRVLYGNGNTLAATAKYDVLDTWRALLDTTAQLTSKTKHALFEQAAALWEQHPAPLGEGSIEAWTHVFCLRREALADETQRKMFRKALEAFIEDLRSTTQPDGFDRELRSWLKLAAFTLRNRLSD